MGKKTLAHKITVQDLLGLFPDELLDRLGDSTNVDRHVKKLFGKNMFYLLLYGFLESTKVSLRGLEDIYNSQKFKFLFNIGQGNSLRYNSLSDRLATMGPDYFKRIYEHAHRMFSGICTDADAEKHSIIRVDSTLVREAANKLQKGMTMGNRHSKGKYVKYTVSMEDLLPGGVEVFTGQGETNENQTIPKVIINQKDKSGIFVFDRGVNKREVFNELDDKGISFVTRMCPTKRMKAGSSNDPGRERSNNLKITGDKLVRLYNSQGRPGKPFRLITTIKDDGSNDELWFLTNCHELPLQEIISIYRKRWDIEVFFRFIKQELNFSHFVSTSLNGIKNVLYITLTLSILILVYKKVNNTGYKTAVRRFRIELDELMTKMMIAFAGGDPSLVFR